MRVSARLQGIHTNGHNAHPDHRHRESWEYEVPHLTLVMLGIGVQASFVLYLCIVLP